MVRLRLSLNCGCQKAAARAAWRHFAAFFKRVAQRTERGGAAVGRLGDLAGPIIVFSGAMISYRWVGDLIHIAVGEEPPVRRGRTAAAPVGGGEPAAAAVQRVSYESLLNRAAAESPGWRRLTLRIPDADDAPLTVQVDHGSGRQPAKWTNLTFDQASGALTARASGQPDSRGARIRFWLRFAHTGAVFGVVGQTIAGVASAGVTLLVWTGLSLTWRRFFGAKKQASEGADAAAS